MKALFTIAAVLMTLGTATAQKVYSVDFPHEADVTVFVARHIHQADLKVFIVDYIHQAGDNDGNWFFTHYPHQASRKIYFIDFEHQADLKIFFVRHRHEAGWISNAQKHLMY